MAWTRSQTPTTARVSVGGGAKARYPRNDYVITSRPQGYRSAPILGARVLQTLPFTEDQVSRFVRAWYRTMEQSFALEVKESKVRQQADTAAEDLLSANPLLLTMIVYVHRYRGALPGSRLSAMASGVGR